MCELLLRVSDKINTDPVLDSKCTKRGDVIVVMPDGWGWGTEELRNPDWRILQLPNVTVEQAASFLSPEPEDNPQAPSLVRQRRLFKIDLDALPPVWAAWVTDGTRAEPMRSAPFTAAQILGYRRRKAPLANPVVI